LEQKIVRSVGDSSLRFKEDALRMLRCIRFSAQLGFRIDKATWVALKKHANLIQHIAMERVGTEVIKIISSSQPMTGLKLLLESGLISHFKSQLFVDEPFWKNQLEAWTDEQFEPIADVSMRWAVLFTILQYDHKSAEQFLRKLKVSNRYLDEVMGLLQFGYVIHSAPITHSTFIDATILYSRDIALKYMVLSYYLPNQFGEQLVNAMLWIEEMPAYSLSDLKVSGRDLIASGIKPGRQLGQILQDMLRQVARKQLPNEYESLVTWATLWREQ
jgi:tRNA nucleotidyltransferase (CCA-adding enzyme)